MKFLVAADIHFHNYRSYSRREKGYNSRLLRTVDAFDVMTKHAAKDGDVDAIFLLGDIFHRRGLLDVDVINKAYQCMRRLARVTKSLTILAGNHDQMSKDGQITSLEVFQDIKGVQVILGPTKFEIFGTQFYLHPYTEDVDGFRRQITEWVDEMNALTPRSRYLMTHMGVQGATVGPYEFEPPSPLALEDLLPGAFAKVFMGHYHKRQEFFPKNCPRSKAMYVGSFLQHNHSEEGDPKGFIEVEEPGGAIIHHKTRQPEFFTIPASNLSDPVEMVRITLAGGHYVKVLVDSEALAVKIRSGIPEDQHYRMAIPAPDLISADPGRETKIKLETPVEEAIDAYVEESGTKLSHRALKTLGRGILRETATSSST